MGQPVHPRPRAGSRSHPPTEPPAHGLGGGFRRRLRDLLNRRRQGHWAERCARGGRALRRHGQQEAQPDSRGFLQRPSRNPPEGLQLPLLRRRKRPAAFADLLRYGRIIPQARALLCRKEWTQLTTAGGPAGAAPHRQLQEGDKGRPPTKLARTSKTRIRSCLPRSGRFAAGSETTNRH